jgi:hypothetical protein
MKKFIIKISCITLFLTMVSSCTKQFEEYPKNPNLSGEFSNVPPDYILRNVLYEVHRGGGVRDNLIGNIPEEPFQQISRWSQYQSGLTFPLYGGTNFYQWTNTASPYSMIKNLNQMEIKAEQAFGTKENPYQAVSKFLKAYTYIWYTNRVGDIPMSEAGQGTANLTPKFDTQKEVFAQCLELLEEANADLAKLLTNPARAALNGDFYFNGDLVKWQRAINAFTLRVLVSLSKRADDTPDLNIKQKFAAILADNSKYPLFTSNNDQVSFKWVAVSDRPNIQFRTLYAAETTVASTIINLTASSEDPRTFVFATPAPAKLTSGGKYDEFESYVGSPQGTAQGTLRQNAAAGMYSFPNFIRYLQNTVDKYPEPRIIIGYAEMCFNIAEGINRGWASGDDEDWYLKGINASLDFFGAKHGSVLTVGNNVGAVVYGTVTADVNTFLSHPNIEYKGGTDGIRQIIEQKYVSFYQTGSWEPLYNYNRTGFPVFDLGTGINPEQKVPLRWLYPPAEVQNNPNAEDAISRQYGSDDVFGVMWMLKD